MKEQYEEKIEELEGQQETLKEQLQTARNEAKSGASAEAAVNSGGQSLLDEVWFVSVDNWVNRKQLHSLKPLKDELYHLLDTYMLWINCWQGCFKREKLEVSVDSFVQDISDIVRGVWMTKPYG